MFEQDLVDAVRAALTAELERTGPPQPAFVDDVQRASFDQWVTACSSSLESQFPAIDARREFLQTVWYESRRAGLETSLVMGVIQVESGFRRYAISSAGARGYMQVMPFWCQVLGGGDASKLFHEQTNLRFGCSILRHYLERERGAVAYALGRYNGRREGTEYAAAVLARRDRWHLANATPPTKTA